MMGLTTHTPLARKLRRLPLLIIMGFLSSCLLLFSSTTTPTLLGNPSLADEDALQWLRNDEKQKEYIDKRGIHVIVGHYMGKDLPWDPKDNLTDDIMNANYYNPVPGVGNEGQPVYPQPTEILRARMLYPINRFNLVVSDKISLDRTLPDARKGVCRNQTYPVQHLPDTSIIIVFHNEAWSTLLRTVHSVINRSPRHLVREIILVDDASEREFLKRQLDSYVRSLNFPIKIIRSPARSGLIRARLMGARAAEGKVLTFLDAHCECTEGWLEPLLDRIATDRTNVVCPIIDIIHDETFAYVKSFELHWGAVNWNLHFRWFPVGSEELKKRRGDPSEPFKTPVMAGGLFAIDKDYFYELGSYDDRMDIWGGENIEMSFRIWQCGGTLEIVPCSHVGHVFRKSSPYTFPHPNGVGGVLFSNLARVAEVWMDEWADFYFNMNPSAKKMRSSQDVEKRKALRQRLHCKSFQWYLDNVWPENFFPNKDRFFGKIRSRKSGRCMGRPLSKTYHQPIGKIKLEECALTHYPRQYFVLTKEGYLMTDESVCLDSPESIEDTNVLMIACQGIKRQQWRYDPKTSAIYHVATHLCLDLPSKSSPDGLTIQHCNGRLSQKWTMEVADWRTEL